MERRSSGNVKRQQEPPGLTLLHHLTGRTFSFFTYQTLVLVLTFIAYACFHAARKPPSIVKGVLHPDDNGLGKLALGSRGVYTAVSPSHSPAGGMQSLQDVAASGNVSGNPSNWTKDPLGGLSAGWPPFDGRLGKGLLGEMDIAFLACYAVGMYFAGQLGDRMDLRIFLSVGMVCSGFFVCLFGMGYFWNIHFLGFFLIAQMLGGLFQSSGWPSVVSIMANWYGKERRGLILGIWNAHTSVGNICGSLVASVALSWGWGWAFLVPGFSIAAGGALVYLFLPPEPGVVGLKPPNQSGPDIEAGQDVIGSLEDGSNIAIRKDRSNHEAGASSPSNQEQSEGTSSDVKVPTEDLQSDEGLKPLKESASSDKVVEQAGAIGFIEAWRIPGVAAFAMCLFFAKLVAYTFLYWLPFYIGHTEINGRYMSSAMAGITSIVFDVGGVFGGILAGHLSDRYKAQASVASLFMTLAVPFMALYFFFGHLSVELNVTILAVVGFFVNGPYALITCAVSADLGQHSSLRGNSKALATVSAIIDGTGSLGAAIGPFLTGLMSEIPGQAGWAAVFLMLMLASLAAVLCLLRLVKVEVDTWIQGWQSVPVEEDAQLQPLQGPEAGG